MNARYFCLSFSVCFLLTFGIGCQKHQSSKSASPAPPYPLSNDTVARVHWIGKKRLEVDAGAYYLSRIWQMPASTQLQTQTLNKLSAFVESAAGFEGKSASFPPQLVHGVLYAFCRDLLQEECFLEARQPANQAAEYALAIRLEEPEAGFWETNSAVLLESLTGALARWAPPPERGWLLARQTPPQVFQLTRAEGWTIIGLSQDKNPLFEDIVSRIRRYQDPFSQPGTNYWLQADIDPRGLINALSLHWSIPTNAPKISLSVAGDGASVLTHGELTFPAGLRVDSEAWDIPTNLIREPLTAFGAVRGIKPLLDSWSSWKDLQFGPAPDQFFMWSGAGGPFETFFAAPMPDAGSRVHQLTERLLSSANPWLNARGLVPFEPIRDSNGVTWGTLAYVKPFLTSIPLGNGEVVFGGLWANADFRTNPSVASAFFQPFSAETNLVYYDWEMTGQRVQPWLDISQMARSLIHSPPLSMDSLGLNWLGSVKSRLGESTTRVYSAGTNQLAFDRKATIGLTAPELHLLVDWLEAPNFPVGLYSLPPRATAPP